MIAGGCAAVVFALGYQIGFLEFKWLPQQRLVERNFYGELRVYDTVETRSPSATWFMAPSITARNC